MIPQMMQLNGQPDHHSPRTLLETVAVIDIRLLM